MWPPNETVERHVFTVFLTQQVKARSPTIVMYIYIYIGIDIDIDCICIYIYNYICAIYIYICIYVMCIYIYTYDISIFDRQAANSKSSSICDPSCLVHPRCLVISTTMLVNAASYEVYPNIYTGVSQVML